MTTFIFTQKSTGRELEITADKQPSMDFVLSEFEKAASKGLFKDQIEAKASSDQRFQEQEKHRFGTQPSSLGMSEGFSSPESRRAEFDERERILSQFTPESIKQAEEQGTIGTLFVKFGRGLTNIGRAFGLADQEDPVAKSSQEALSAVRPVASFVGEVAGESAPFAPAGIAVGAIRSTAARVIAAFGLGGLEGEIIARGQGAGEGQQLVSSVLGASTAATFEAFMPIVVRRGARIIRKATGSTPKGAVIDDLGNPSPEFTESLEKLGIDFTDVVEEAKQELIEVTGKSIDPDEAARFAFLKSQGIEPVRAQVSRNTDDFSELNDLAKTNHLVRDVLDGQEAALTARFDNAVFETDGVPSLATVSAFDAITEKSSILDQKIFDLYDAAKIEAKGQKIIEFKSLQNTLKALKGFNRGSKGAISIVSGFLKDNDFQVKVTPGVERAAVETGVSGRRKVFKPGIAPRRVTPDLTVEDAEKTRRFINKLHDPKNSDRAFVLRKLKDALDDDVFKASGGDLFKEARQAKRDFEVGLDRAKISKFDSRKKNLVRDILENKIDAKNFVNDVVFTRSWRAEDLQQLKKYISTSKSGVKAFNDLKADVIDEIKKRSFIGRADKDGFKVLNVEAMKSTLDNIGEERLRVLFSKGERDFLNKMLEVARIKEPVRGSVGTSAGLTNLLTVSQRLGGDGVGGGGLRITTVPAKVIEFVTLNRRGKIAIKALPDVPEKIQPSQLRGAITPFVTGAAVREDIR